MIQKKVCMLGTFGVGKTSLVERFVHSIFSDKYVTTVGVKISKKVISSVESDVTLIIWDIHGDDEFQSLNSSHLRGMSGYLLVADGTRAVTLERAVELQQRVQEVVGPVPFVLALNKIDLQSLWEVGEERIAALTRTGWCVIRTSAKSGDEVNEAFRLLGARMISSR